MQSQQYKHHRTRLCENTVYNHISIFFVMAKLIEKQISAAYIVNAFQVLGNPEEIKKWGRLHAIKAQFSLY